MRMLGTRLACLPAAHQPELIMQVIHFYKAHSIEIVVKHIQNIMQLTLYDMP